MKKHIFAILSITTLLFTTGCEDFLDRPSKSTVLDNSTFWRNETDFRMYSVQFYPWFFTGYNSGYGTNYTPLTGYTFSDNNISGEGKQSNFIANVPTSLGVAVSPGSLLSQSWYSQFNGEMWNFGWVRAANIMIQRVEQYKGNLSDAGYKHWMSVARFFRAYAYFNLVLTFGDVPYFDKPVEDTDKATLFKDRDPRGDVMDKVYDDLKYAMENAYALDNGSALYVNKYVIAGFASRIMLFEGTWEKYQNLSAERAKKYLELAVASSEVVMNSGKWNCTTNSFRDLFGSESLASNKEVIFYREYTAAQVTHAVASYANGTEGQAGGNLQLIKSFLCNDGKPYTTSTLANASDFNLSVLAKTRDPRFEATFFNRPMSKSQTFLYCNKFISRLGASYWNNVAARPAMYGSNLNENDAPVMRLGEVLLNWIEAKQELALSYGGAAVSQADIDKSINAIRKRPLDATAIANGVSLTAPLSLAALPSDPARDADVDALLWEIRRERRMEFVYEFARLMDIKRWAKISYMDNTKYPDTMYGTWVNFPVDAPDFLSTAYKGKLKVRKADGTEVTYDGTNGAQMVGFYKVINVAPRDAFVDAKVYVSPVGMQEIEEYAAQGFTLTQTKAWQ